MRFAVALLAATAGATAALGEPVHDTPQRLSEPTDDVARASNRSFVAMPIPLSDPAIGTGLGIAAMALYNESEAGRPWTTGVGGLYTDSSSWGVAAFHKAHFAEDRYRLTAAGGYGLFNVDFYGIGSAAGDRNVAIPLEQAGAGALLDLLMRVRPHVYLGVRYRGATVDTTVKTSTFPFPDLELPDIELQSTVSGLGLSAEVDTRDAEFGPQRGILFEGQLLAANEALGSSFEYGSANAALNGYHALGDDTVLAWRMRACWAGDGAPFFDLCNFGSQNDLRGYTNGQYRDHTMLSVQGELRRRLFWRFGGVLFAGVGEVARSLEEMDGDSLLPAAGVGLRFEASRAYGVNLSVDYAVGEDSSAVYFYVGEAF